MPAPQVCDSIDCGPRFNEDVVPFRPLSFLNWQQLVVLVLGLALFALLLTLSFRRPRT
ncbi:MAG: hypothetical protein M3O84_07730 [Actinomycetota bacterium]|nr:hypothetical protein [Actinomycetota bacterium]